MGRIPFTPDDALAEVLAALASNPIRPDKSFTTEELAARIPCGLEAAQRRLKRLQAEGRLEVVRITKMNMVGVLQATTGYRILDRKGK